jgi:hypothetical protein
MQRVVVHPWREAHGWPQIRGELGLPNDLHGAADSVRKRRNVSRLGQVGMINGRSHRRVGGSQPKLAARLRREQSHRHHAFPPDRQAFVWLHPRIHMQVERAVGHR